MSRKTISSPGEHSSSSGAGSDVELCSGILIARFDHLGDGEFKAELVKSRMLSRQHVRLLRTVLCAATAVAAGSLVGLALGYLMSVQYVLQMATGLATALLTLAGQPLLAKVTEPAAWCVGAGAGTLANWAVVQVVEGDKRGIRPGQHRLEVRSAGEWSCDFRQPRPGERMELGPDDTVAASEPMVYGSLVFGSCPTIRVQNFAGLIHAEAFSIDGQHRSTVYRRSGSFWEQGISTDLRPGTEYIIFVRAYGQWLLAFNYEQQA